jgi:hypothetical protein
VTTIERLLLRQLGGATKGSAKPCHGVGGLARRARKRRRVPSGLDLVGGRDDAKPTFPIFSKG